MEDAEELALSDPEDDDLLEAPDVKAPSAKPSIPYEGGVLPPPTSSAAASSASSSLSSSLTSSSVSSRKEHQSSPAGNPVLSANGQPGTASNSDSFLLLTTSSKDAITAESEGLASQKLDFIASDVQEKLQRALADLEEERTARKAAEKAKASSEEAKTAAFARFKVLAQEAVKQRDEANRQRDEAQSVVDGLWREKEEAMKARDAARAEMEQAAVVLGAEAERILARVTGQDRHAAGGGGGPLIPKSGGLAAIVQVLKKRLDSSVEELIRQRDAAREEAEQRNLESAIEVSQLESTISGLKEENGKRREEIERWKDAIAAKDGKLGQVFTQLEGMEGKCKRLELVLSSEKTRGDDAESKVKIVESELRKLKVMAEEKRREADEGRERVKEWRSLILELESKLSAMEASGKEVGGEAKRKGDSGEEGEGEQEMGHDGGRRMVERVDSFLHHWKDLRKEWFAEKQSFIERFEESSAAKELLVNELSSLREDYGVSQSTVVGLQTRVVNQEEELGKLKILLQDFQSGEYARKAESDVEKAKVAAKEAMDAIDLETNARKEAEEARHIAEEMASQAEEFRKEAEKGRELAISEAAARAEEAVAARVELQEIEREFRAARREIEGLQELIQTLEKSLADEKAISLEILAREATALQEVHRLQELLADMEEEAARWRAAASEEATAGASVVDELEAAQEQISVLQSEIVSWKKTAEEAMDRIKTKEETALSAMVARDTAEKSLKIADKRVLDMRRRMEEMATQMEEAGSEGGGDRERESGCLSAAWPWIYGLQPSLQVPRIMARGGRSEMTAEMEELTEPLILS